MNYPLWDLPTVGGGSLIALIAILHVFISHLAVGGGVFLWLLDRRAVRTGDQPLLGYVRRHTWFFLLLTMVFGGVTGVGIWFIIALVHPSATSALIHLFVFGWAIEWVFFVGEIAALLIYHYRWDVLSNRQRHQVAFFYALFAWLSLVVINGILTFMLTPGAWLVTHEFWDGFFNPTMLPALVFRTCMAGVMAGVFGYVTAIRMEDPALRRRLAGLCGWWVLIPLGAGLLAAGWYFAALAPPIRERAFAVNPQTRHFVFLFLGASVILAAMAVAIFRRLGVGGQRTAAVVLLVFALLWIGGFEYVREIARKPFIITGFMYDSSILVDSTAALNTDGILAHARWSGIREITAENRRDAGREVFRLECQACHTLGGIRNDVLRRVRNFTLQGMEAQLVGQGKVQDYMPPFFGIPAERQALAAFLLDAAGVRDSVEVPTVLPQLPPLPLPPFNAASSEYVLLAWNDLGMHCLSDGDRWFCFLPPANTLEAQLLKRGDPPLLVTSGVELGYAVEPGHANPAAHSDFWKYARSLVGRDIPLNVGLSGNGTSGVFQFDSTHNGWRAEFIPLVPYTDDGSVNPYPAVTVEAREKSTGRLLATTTVIAPVSAEIGCRHCHGGTPRLRGSGLGEETARHILAAHDRLNGTRLLKDAEAGQPALCQSCHEDPALNAPGRPGVLGLSAAMHGWHAQYLPGDNSQACGLCHPSLPAGGTRCLRDLHASLELECTQCHGSMDRDAIALLGQERGKDRALRIARALPVEGKDSIAPRTAWHDQVDCMNCHVDFLPPTGMEDGTQRHVTGVEGLYRMRTDGAGMRCPACHGSTHALYPSHNLLARDRDNTQPLQYTGMRGPVGADKNCAVCHRKPMQDAIHHPNMERMFRNVPLLE